MNTFLQTQDPRVSFTPTHSIWIDDGFQIAKRFRRQSDRYFNARTTAIDFSDPQSVRTISDWVEGSTRGMVIEIDEAGTEAGAGTVVEIKKMHSVEAMTVNKPFLFAIRDMNSDAILFLGKVANPSE